MHYFQTKSARTQVSFCRVTQLFTGYSATTWDLPEPKENSHLADRTNFLHCQQAHCGSGCCFIFVWEFMLLFQEVGAQKFKPGKKKRKSDTSLKLMLRKMLRICKHLVIKDVSWQSSVKTF